MFRPARPFLLLSLFLVVSSIGSAQDKMIETPYYPLAKDTTWQYKTSDGTRWAMKVVGHEKEKNVLCARIERIDKKNEKEACSELVGVTPEGVFRFAITTKGNVPIVADKPVMILKLPLKAGDSWTVDSKGLGDSLKGSYKVGEEKEITVPAGKYKAFPITTEDLDVSGIKVSDTRYYAKDVGLIKQEFTIGKQTTVFELEKFELGK